MINYYPEATEELCKNAVTNSTVCGASEYWAAGWGRCQPGFKDMAPLEFDTSPYAQVSIYSSTECIDTDMINFREYRLNSCYLYNGSVNADDDGGLSRKAVFSGSTFTINIYSDTNCFFYHNSTSFVADGVTCQDTYFYNNNNLAYVSVSIPSTNSSSNTSSISGSSSALSTGAIVGIAIGAIAAILGILAFIFVSRSLKQSKTGPTTEIDIESPKDLVLPASDATAGSETPNLLRSKITIGSTEHRVPPEFDATAESKTPYSLTSKKESLHEQAKTRLTEELVIGSTIDPAVPKSDATAESDAPDALKPRQASKISI
ncbi:hypothetical protein HK100_007761 [Physocladia obscura]|uniref:Uncharacterized protein n=1 Tax=Physocladia obscura TaxID=109957 RepID=A0AAD5SQ17_9FUNG|nr:hypothetical protein HK100_007761 [Physocladia obscura]